MSSSAPVFLQNIFFICTLFFVACFKNESFEKVIIKFEEVPRVISGKKLSKCGCKISCVISVQKIIKKVAEFYAIIEQNTEKNSEYFFGVTWEFFIEDQKEILGENYRILKSSFK